MNLGALLQEFFHDDKVAVALLVIALDFVFGILAALKADIFRLSYVSDFLRNDVLFKLFPYFVLYAGAQVAGGADVVVPGLDMGLIAGAVYVVVIAAWVGSILNSLRTLGLFRSMTNEIAGEENAAPPKS